MESKLDRLGAALIHLREVKDVLWDLREEVGLDGPSVRVGPDTVDLTTLAYDACDLVKDLEAYVSRARPRP